jgi:hypothetical protein
MKKIISCIITTLICYTSFTQVCCTPKPKNWSLSSSVGYVNVSTIKQPIVRYQSNIWGSLNINYSTSKWSYGGWVGTNYWVNGKQPDLRGGFSITRTIKKW